MRKISSLLLSIYLSPFKLSNDDVRAHRRKIRTRVPKFSPFLAYRIGLNANLPCYRCHVINAETEHANSQVLLRLAAQCADSSTDPCARSQQSTNGSQSSVQRLDAGERSRRGTPLLLQSMTLSRRERFLHIFRRN